MHASHHLFLALAIALFLVSILPKPTLAAQHPSFPQFASPISANTISKQSVSFPNNQSTDTITVSMTDSAIYRYVNVSFNGQNWMQRSFQPGLPSSCTAHPDDPAGTWLTGTCTLTMRVNASNFSLSSPGTVRRNYITAYSCTENTITIPFIGIFRLGWDCHGSTSTPQMWQIHNYSATLSEWCGSGTCGSAETCSACSADCGACCTPYTCSGLGYSCGNWSDGCGGTLSCGTCGTGYTCNATGKCASTAVMTWTGELMTNRGFESGTLTGWTTVGSGWVAGSHPPNSQFVMPQSGSYCAYYGAASSSGYYIYQDVNLTAYASYIDSGLAVVNASGWGVSSESGGQDLTRIQVIFLNPAKTVIGTPLDTGYLDNGTWWKRGVYAYAVPANTRYVRMWGNTYENGFDSGSLDTFSVRVGYGGTPCTPSCSGKTCGSDGCGGSCGSCSSGYVCSSGRCIAQASTCSDGIQNQGETGVDCGGPCPACPAGTIYYVSTSGSDSNSGTDTGHPWRTLAYAEAHATEPGSAIALRKGDVWLLDNYLEITHGGSEAAPIVWDGGLWGDANSSKAIIRANSDGDLYPKGYSLVHIADCDYLTMQNIIFDGDEYERYGVVIGGNTGVVGQTEQNDESNITIQDCELLDFGHGASYKIAFLSQPMNTDMYNITFRRNVVDGASNHGICFYANRATQKTTHDVYVGYNNVTNCGKETFGDSILFVGGYDSAVIERNIIRQGEGVAFGFAAECNATLEQSNMIFRYNDIRMDDRPAFLIQGSDGNTSGGKLDYDVHHNLFYRDLVEPGPVYPGQDGPVNILGWDYRAGSSLNFYNNVMVIKNGGYGFHSYSPTNGMINFINNIVVRTSDDGFIFGWAPTAAAPAAHSNNVYYKTTGDDSDYYVEFGGIGDKSQMAAWEPTAILDDPLLRDILVVFDWHPYEGSPAIDAGIDVGLTEDFEGNIIPQGSAPDIGAFEAPNHAWVYNHSDTQVFDDVIFDHPYFPECVMDAVRSDLHIFYGHTSHGDQLMDGLGMIAAENGTRFALPDITEAVGDLGHTGNTAWVTTTRNHLASHPETNVVMWSWGDGCSDNTDEGIDTYLSEMTELENDYPDVKFVYMTGHLDGTGPDGLLYHNNNRIREYVNNNSRIVSKILYDFADVESYDPDGSYYPDATDACLWCVDWCNNSIYDWGKYYCPTCDDSCDNSHCYNCFQQKERYSGRC